MYERREGERREGEREKSGARAISTWLERDPVMMIRIPICEKEGRSTLQIMTSMCKQQEQYVWRRKQILDGVIMASHQASVSSTWQLGMLSRSHELHTKGASNHVYRCSPGEIVHFLLS